MSERFKPQHPGNRGFENPFRWRGTQPRTVLICVTPGFRRGVYEIIGLPGCSQRRLVAIYGYREVSLCKQKH